MIFEDVVKLTQNAVSQALGEGYKINTGVGEDGNPTYETIGTGNLAALDTSKLIDVGKDVLDSGSVDVYVKALLTQMGKMIVVDRKYEDEVPGIMVDTNDWGGYQMRVYFSPQDLVKDEMYSLVDGQTYEDHKFYQPKVSAKIYEEGKDIMCPISIVREQLFEAFRGWDEMTKFLSGVYQNVLNTITLGTSTYQHMLVSVGYAIAKEAGNIVHLMTEFYGSGYSETQAAALKDPAFLRYALSRIAEIKDNMKLWTSSYNNGSVPTFSPNANVLLINKIARSMKFFARPDTYHPDGLGIEDYDTITAWQAFKSSGVTDFDYSTVSQIKIAADANNKLGLGTSEVDISNAVGLIYDPMAIGMTLRKSKVTSNYTAIADFWNQYYHQLVNYIIDSNFNMVAIALD